MVGVHLLVMLAKVPSAAGHEGCMGEGKGAQEGLEQVQANLKLEVLAAAHVARRVVYWVLVTAICLTDQPSQLGIELYLAVQEMASADADVRAGQA